MAPPVAGYKAWYDPTLITGHTDGSVLSSETDQSGNGWTLTPASGFTAPTYYSTTSAKLINGLPTIYYNSSVGDVQVSALFNSSTGLAQPFTLYLVVQQGATAGDDGDIFDTYQLAGQSNTNRAILSLGCAGIQSGIAAMWAGNAWANAGTLTGITTPQVVTVVYNGASSVYRRNQVAQTLGANPGADVILGVEIGGANLSTAYEGLRGEFILYMAAHSGSQITSTENYLVSKWVPSLLPYAPPPPRRSFVSQIRASHWRERISGLLEPRRDLVIA